MATETITTNARWSIVQFFCISLYTVGFSGFTQLPEYVRRHTGLFLVAYYILAVLICIPLCYVQLKLGSLFRTGIVGIFNYAMPILKGSAIALLAVSYIRVLLRGVDISYGLSYMVSSLRQPYPWTATVASNSTGVVMYFMSPAQKYFNEDFLEKSPSIGVGGSLLWYHVVTLLLSWSLIGLLVVRGSSSLGKIVYFLCPVSLILLLAVFIYGHVMVPNAGESIRSLFSDLRKLDNGQDAETITELLQSRLGRAKVWIDAMRLHIENIGLWAGVLPTLGSHIYHSKAVVNTAWLSLIVIYCVIPPIVLIAILPFGLPSSLFGHIPDTFSQLGLSPVVLACIYLCFFLFGLLNQAVHFLAIVENLLRGLPQIVRRFTVRDECLVAVVCLLSFLLSLGYASQCGPHLHALVQDYHDVLLFIPITLSVIPFLTAYVKQESLHLPIERACASLWFGGATLVSGALLIYHMLQYISTVPKQDWVTFLGWSIATVPILLGIMCGATHAIVQQKGSVGTRILLSLKMGSNISDLHETDISNVMDTGDESKNDQPIGDCPIDPHLTPKPEVVAEVEVSIKPSSNGSIARL